MNLGVISSSIFSFETGCSGFMCFAMLKPPTNSYIGEERVYLLDCSKQQPSIAGKSGQALKAGHITLKFNVRET